VALLTQPEIEAAFRRLGELAIQHGEQIHLVIVGGAVMLLVYQARNSTRDVDAVILTPRVTSELRKWIKQVANEQDLPENWLNDGAKGYLVGISEGPIIFSVPGIQVRMPSVAQLLAMKLSAWRDETDIDDARHFYVNSRAIKTQFGARWNRIWFPVAN
jgi:predicted nucleotidyltransferase